MSISVQGISKSFKGRRKGEPENEVLKDVNFEVEEGANPPSSSCRRACFLASCSR